MASVLKGALLHLLFPTVTLIALPALPSFAQQRCVSGYVWREAYSGDFVCVTPETREQAADDNAQAAARRFPSSDTCRQGYVWREARPEDHVCVVPAVRAQTWEDNAQAANRVVIVRKPPIHANPGGLQPPSSGDQGKPPGPSSGGSNTSSSPKPSPSPGSQSTAGSGGSSSGSSSGFSLNSISGILTALGGFITAVATLMVALRARKAKADQ